MSKKEEPDRPEILQVGPFIYEVLWGKDEWSEAIETARDANELVYGMTDPKSSRIYMNPHCAETQLRDTLLHEVLHACHFSAGISTSEEMPPEQFVTRVSPILLDTLRRNPELRDYIFWM